tara:strand:- start:1786 stop:5616 length:3831 start_codon:yes stop_codon:yes gene_type:complete
MIELPPKFKMALGDGVRTSLNPLVKIYKDIRLEDDDYSLASEVITLSTKEFSIINEEGDVDYYKPLLLKSPNIASKADIVDNKYTISSVSLSVSNAEFQGERFSDKIQDYLNSVCQIYYTSNGIDSINDCLLVYTGTIRRFNQNQDTVNLTLEDLTQQLLQNTLPSQSIPNEPYYSENMVGKPYPMVYGYVNKSPLIPRSEGTNEEGNISQSLEELHIDKKGALIGGLMDSVNIDAYGHSFFNENHPLFTHNYLKNVGSLSIFQNDSFVPISRTLDVRGWSYKDLEIDLTEDLYSFVQSSGEDSSASIVINPNTFVQDEEIIGIPTRIYRPIEKVEFKTYSDSNGGSFNSTHRIYGFTDYVRDGQSGYEPWNRYAFITSASEDSPYDDNWDNGDQSWWEPTDCNHTNHGGDSTFIDNNWIHKDNTRGFFPVNRLQDGYSDRGLLLTAVNLEELDHSGWTKVIFNFKSNVGNYPCSTKYVYDMDYHSFHNMTDTGKRMLPMIWHFGSTPNADWGSGLKSTASNRARDIINPEYSSTPHEWPIFPQDDDTVWSVNYDVAPYQSSTEETITHDVSTYYESTYVDETTKLSGVTLGVPQMHRVGSSGTNDRGYYCGQLFNFYCLQDTVVTEAVSESYFADVAGRISDTVDINIYGVCTADVSGSSGTYYNVTFDKVEYPEVSSFNIGNIVSVYGSDDTDFGYHEIHYTQETDTEKRMTFRKSNASAHPEFYEGVEVYIIGDLPLVIQSAEDIMADILRTELGYIGNIEHSNATDRILNAFTLNETKEAKDVMEKLFKSSLTIPTFNAKGHFKFLHLFQEFNSNTIESIDRVKLDNSKVLNYSFSLTKIDDVKNSINVKYNINYGTGDFDGQTGYGFTNSDGNINVETYDEATQLMYPNDDSFVYDIGYYGLTNEEAKLEVESEYIRDLTEARKLQERLLHWYANQHLIIKLKLSIDYLNLEVGDYIYFDELLGNVKAFGYDYTKNTNRNGQLIYKYFFVTNVRKSLDRVDIEAVQVHRGYFGFYDGWDVEETEESGTPSFGGNNGDANFEQGDPYDYGTDIDEGTDTSGWQEDFSDEPYIDVYWENGNDNLNHSPTAIISTNIEGEFDVDVLVILNEEPFEYGDSQPPQVMQEVQEGQEQSANNYFSYSTHYNFENGIRKGGKVYLSTPYLIPEGHTGIIGILRITYQGTEYTKDLYFTQLYFTPPPPLLGDLNDDGSINALDVVIMAGAVAYNNTEHLPDTADMNGDGTVNLLDIVMLVNQIVNSNDEDEGGEDEASPT